MNRPFGGDVTGILVGIICEKAYSAQLFRPKGLFDPILLQKKTAYSDWDEGE